MMLLMCSVQIEKWVGPPCETQENHFENRRLEDAKYEYRLCRHSDDAVLTLTKNSMTPATTGDPNVAAGVVSQSLLNETDDG